MIAWITSSTALTALVIGLRQALKGRISSRVRYALWLLVLLRLLIPGTLASSRVSVQNALPEAMFKLPVLAATESPAVPETVRPAASAPAEPTAKAVQEEKTETPRAEGLLRVIWLGGAAALLLTAAVSNVCFALRLHRSRVRRTDVNSHLPVYTVSWLSTPCLVGLLRPVICLSEGLDGEALRHVLAHEETHYRHADPLWSRLRLLALALHWYNPLAWAAALLSKRDAELACDEATLQRLGDGERRAYGETLLRLSCPRFGQLLNLSTAMTDSRRSLFERVRLIARKQRMAAPTLLLVLLLAGFAALSAFTGAADAEGERYSAQLESTDGSITAALDFPRNETLFPDGAPVITLTPHVITTEETRAAAEAVFGDEALFWRLPAEAPVTRETAERWLELAHQLENSDFYERISAGNENVLRHRYEELDELIGTYENPDVLSALPRDGECPPVAWSDGVGEALAERDGIFYRITSNARDWTGTPHYLLQISPMDIRPAPLYAYALETLFGGEEITATALERASEQATVLAERMGLGEWTLVRDCRGLYFPFPSYEREGGDMIRVELERRYDPRLRLQATPSGALMDSNCLSLELSPDGKLIDLTWAWPLDATHSEEAELITWEELIAAIEHYVRSASAESFGFAAFAGEEPQRIEHPARVRLVLNRLQPGLSYQESVPGSGRWRLIPSVAVYGSAELLDAAGEAFSLDGASFARMHSPSQPLFTLSALDGSLLEDMNTTISPT